MEDFMASKNQNGKMPNEHLHELFVDELRDIMGAERQLLKGLKKMTNATKSESLKTAFETHYAETEEHINRLKQVMESLGLAARGKKCKAMEGLLAEADEIIESFEGDEAIDAALIAAAQKVEHYEIASIGSRSEEQPSDLQILMSNWNAVFYLNKIRNIMNNTKKT